MSIKKLNILKGDNEYLNNELFSKGFVKIGFLPKNVLDDLRKDSYSLIKKTLIHYPKGELFNLINSDFEIKSSSNKIVDNYFTPYLTDKLDNSLVDCFPVSHLIKPFGLKSDIWHQDSSIVDEREAFSLNAWVSLINSNRYNGCLWVLPGSHINEIYFRQFGYNPITNSFIKKIKKELVPIEAKAGEVVLFHRNLIHGSSVNLLTKRRVAIESVIISKNAQLYNFHRDEKISKSKVLGFKVDINHFMGANPKEDFYNGKYDYDFFEDNSLKYIQEYFLQNISNFKNFANGG
jgi:hypothetical protein